MSVADDTLKVLMMIGQNGPISRTKIGRNLNFAPSRITRLCDNLLEKGLIHETGREKSTGGRRSALLELKEANHLLCGVLISFSSLVHIVLMDLRANILQEKIFSVPPSILPDDLADQIALAIRSLAPPDTQNGRRLLGMGVGISGLADPKTGMVHSSPGLPRWHEAPFASILSARLNIPAYLENEVAMSTLAELWFGLGRGCSNFLYVNLGPGVRMGIVVDGTLYRGSTGNAGELGHITFDAFGPICHCGNIGCLEVFTSTEALLSDARQSLRMHSGSRLLEMSNGQPETLRAEDIYQAAQEGDRLALTLLWRLCQPLGLTLANQLNVFDTEMLIIGGSLAQAGDIILKHLEEKIRRHTLPVMSRNIKIVLTSFGHDQRSAAIGGGGLILQKICEGEIVI
ncbi:MAG: ROK family transcriptional regulator [Candidatus Sumerlaeota bacterium]|nr:ROK family transcriptional regulator [Candidatus Sumerlaeota bacterium]